MPQKDLLLQVALEEPDASTNFPENSGFSPKSSIPPTKLQVRRQKISFSQDTSFEKVKKSSSIHLHVEDCEAGTENFGNKIESLGETVHGGSTPAVLHHTLSSGHRQAFGSRRRWRCFAEESHRRGAQLVAGVEHGRPWKIHHIS